MAKQATQHPAELKGPDGLVFAHASEAELARILNFYRIPWEYEPKTFPLRWGETGQPVECITPDFYLPTQKLYLEVTTIKPRLMAKKRRKVRLLQELYPHVKIRLFQNRDIHQLMWKYGQQ